MEPRRDSVPIPFRPPQRDRRIHGRAAIGKALLVGVASETIVTAAVHGLAANGTPFAIASDIALAVSLLTTVARESLAGNGDAAVPTWLPLGLK